MSLLTAVALDLSHGHTRNTTLVQSIAHILKLEWFDNSLDQLHSFSPLFAVRVL